jgi:NADH-quinone oxidoreductase subunit L
MGGLGRKMPVTTVSFLVALLAISGIFPFSGFWSKDEILEAVLSNGNMLLYVVSLVTVFLTAFYMARVFFVVFAGESSEKGHAHESPRTMTIPLIVLGMLSFGLGVIGLPWLKQDIHTFLAPLETRPAGINFSVLLQSDILALAGILTAFVIYGLKLVKPETLRRAAGPVYKVLVNKFYVDELYMLLIKGVFFTVSRAVAWFDRHVVDGAVNFVGWLSKKGGEALRRTITGKVQGYALVVFCGVALTLVVLLAMSLGAGR